MTNTKLNAIASALNTKFEDLKSRKLYVYANFSQAVTLPNGKILPDRVLVHGLKNLESTGTLTSSDRTAILNIINDTIGSSFKFKQTVLDDPCMFCGYAS